MTHKEREAEADRLMAILRGDGDATLITETGELQTSPDGDYYEEYGVPGAIAGKFTLSGITENPLMMVTPIFVSKNNAVEACCCT